MRYFLAARWWPTAAGYCRLLLAAAMSAAVGRTDLHAQATTGTYVIRGGTVVPVVGARIPNGTVVISGGKIQAVGANVQAPQGATVIDATGLFVYPGMARITTCSSRTPPRSRARCGRSCSRNRKQIDQLTQHVR